MYIHSVAIEPAVIKQFDKKHLSEKIALPVRSISVPLDVAQLCFICWGTKHQGILMRLAEQEPVIAMANQDLKKYCMYHHVSTMDNICDSL